MSDQNDQKDQNEKKRERPNANYKLSNENATDEQIIHYYNREHRLAKAPQSVRDLYKPQEQYRFNLIRPLVRTRPLAFMFMSIVIICIVIVLISLLGLTGTSYNLDGNYLSIQAINFEGTIIMTIDKTTKKSGINRFKRVTPPYTGAVEIALQPALKSGETGSEVPQDIFFHKIFFTLEPQEIYRFSVPFDTDELAVVLRTEAPEPRSLRFTVTAE